MSRSAVPSQAQIEKLVDILEGKRWLATVHVETAQLTQACDRTRTAWQEIAVQLNSEGTGCIKNWQQWAKYWKDKKAAAKKKASQIRMARNITGGGASEVILHAIEDRIVALMGGESFASGDRELEIEPIQGLQTTTSTQDKPESQINVDQLHNSRIPANAAGPIRNSPAVSSSPRRRRLFASRRRGLVRSPPSQRNPQLASLTEKFIAIEEKRAETDLILAQNQQLLTNATVAISESVRDLVMIANRRFH